jgi:FkbM family methyltransferase
MSLKKTIIDSYTINVLDNDWVGGSIINGTPWEQHITFFLKRNLKKNSIFFDIGSNYGWHSITTSHLCEKIYSFEPQKYVFEIQKDNISQNNIDNIELYNIGIGNKNEYREMNPINYNDSVNVGDLSVGIGGEKIEIKTIDSLNIDKVDFIKIDVQGYEKFVLEGGTNTLNKNKPILIIEMENHQLKKFNYDVTDLFNLIYDLGYYIYLLDYHYPSDHICVHKDNLDDFISNNRDWIRPLTEDNSLNHNVKNMVKEKIIYQL